MELWIRSQDKTKLLKCESLVIDNTCPEMESVGEYCICDSFEGHIAKYKTKERALEVLNEIQSKIHQTFIYEVKVPIGAADYRRIKSGLKFEYPNNEFIMQPIDCEIKPINSNVIVYEMPRD